MYFVTQVSDRDRKLARGLPAAFKQCTGAPVDRVVSLVLGHWGSRDPSARAELAQALLPILEGLVQPGVPVIPQQSDLCENVVTGWLEKTISHTPSQ